MKLYKYICLFIFVFFIFCYNVNARVTCKDGTTSPTCDACTPGCCSHHGGCSKSSYSGYNNFNYNNNSSDNASKSSDTEETEIWPYLLGATIVGSMAYNKDKIIKLINEER